MGCSMDQLLCDINQTTQPVQHQKIFNNWDVVVKGWYAVCKTREIRKGKTKSVMIGGQQLALFRSKSGRVYALDAFCPHMGMDLSKGSVKGGEYSVSVSPLGI